MATEEALHLTYEQFRTKLAEVLGERFSSASAVASLYDELGVDSLEAWELVAITEAVAGARSTDHLPHMYIMGDLYDFYLAIRNSAVSGSLNPISDADLNAIRELATGLRRDAALPGELSA